ncbi:hypothetical protein [Caldilinea sp.]|uniref:hypothetical protein n=1 Tax=Caldilinea sp. TaxID=2293560 RepID=UPI002C591BD5|nr:hypothetical protein [Caldilinea sp.]HRA66387.1 hypothetical protein [Caldilinea sp.]
MRHEVAQFFLAFHAAQVGRVEVGVDVGQPQQIAAVWVRQIGVDDTPRQDTGIGSDGAQIGRGQPCIVALCPQVDVDGAADRGMGDRGGSAPDIGARRR